MMFKSSACKLLFLFLPIFAVSCNVWRTDEAAAPSPTPFVASEIKTEIPFSTKEPETYQTEIVIQTVSNGENTERKIFAARDGGRRLTVFKADGKSEISVLESADGQIFSIHRGEKIYTENQTAMPTTTSDFLTVEWLNQKIPAVFEKLETAENLSKFRVKLGDGDAQNSEILIYVDENLKLPIKQEFYSINGEQRTLTFSAEMKNFKLEAGAELFEVPKDYRKVSAKEFQDFLWKERTNE